MKVKRLVFVWFVLVFAVGFSSCKDLLGGLGEDDKSPPEMEVLSPEDFLILSHLDEHPVRDVEEVTAIVENFLYVVGFTGSGAKPVITGAPELHDIPVDKGFAVKSPDSGEETIPASSTLPFYRYEIIDTATGTPGAVIASGDKRIGNIIAYIEQETEDDAMAVPFMEMFLDNLTAYVKTTIDTYNSVTPEEIEAAKRRANSTGRQASKTSNAALSVNREVVGKIRTTFPPLAQSRWNQNEGYWDVVNAARGTSRHYVGCVAVAMGQVLAYHEWPGVCSLTGTFNNPFASGTPTDFWLLDYDWDAMKAKPSATDSGMSADGKLGINVLLYEAGVKVGMQYGADSSRAPMRNIVPALKSMAYDVSQSAVRPYNYDTIVTSINRRQPVIIAADSIAIEHTYTWIEIIHHWLDLFHWFDEEIVHTGTYTTYEGGHAWVIDDYEIWYNEEEGHLGTGIETWAEYFVHCNLGWGGYKTGWYKSGVFDTNRVVYDEQRSISGVISGIQRSVSGTSGYYRYNMQIIPFLKPNK